MCGIVGYIGERNATPVLLKGLEHLEYRGYDSAGITCLNGSGRFFTVKERGKLAGLKKQLSRKSIRSSVGIGHTRWATHGEPSKRNAHPHTDNRGILSLVHNGIIENHSSLREELSQKGCRFFTQTDTEVAANLISYYSRQKGSSFIQAFRKALSRLEGFFAFAVLHQENPEQLLVFKRSNPLVIGLGDGENFVASDVPALLPYTKRIVYLEDEEYAILTKNKVEIFSAKTGKSIKRSPSIIRWDVSQAAKGGYPHFMLKEIYEQPQVAETTLQARLKKTKIFFDSISKKFEQKLKKIQNIRLVSCGTAYHAGLIGNYMLNRTLNLSSETCVSSEFRYGDPNIGKQDLVIVITQSGETADTLAALREAKKKGAMTLAIVNVVGSTIAREADAVIYTHAGPEIGVASTKAYVAQLMILALFSLYLAKIHSKRKMKESERNRLLREFKILPQKIEKALTQEKVIHHCASKLRKKRNFLYVGRGCNFPTALEGALKLKEITYAHAHGYPAGEMKHGPIALIDSNQPVLCLCLKQSKTYDKMCSNIEEIRARKGIVISIAARGDREIQRLSRYVFEVPDTPEFLSPILTVIPFQLFAYKVAVFNGRDVDQPRNLAKSVTVE